MQNFLSIYYMTLGISLVYGIITTLFLSLLVLGEEIVNHPR